MKKGKFKRYVVVETTRKVDGKVRNGWEPTALYLPDGSSVYNQENVDNKIFKSPYEALMYLKKEKKVDVFKEHKYELARYQHDKLANDYYMKFLAAKENNSFGKAKHYMNLSKYHSDCRSKQRELERCLTKDEKQKIYKKYFN